ncbi:site-specific DNA-methyltransferase [Psychrobacter sp. AT9]|uniref:site-specific DNA-methyltransferase n=1 Tax=Psychrobacter sp. AT9 TaxID=3242893 RepID=UPI0039A5E4A6
MTNLSTETLFDETETANSKQIAILKKHFPQCFDKDGHFQPEKMMEVVKANEVDMVKESYSLNWLGKAYARLLTNLPPQKLLKPDTTHNERAENSDSGNILIKGDNLEVLKHLVNGYREKIKMIYIDPPYNTGSDGFAYQDSFKFSINDLSRLADIDKIEAERVLSFNAKGSNSHSAWLTFMYPRLYIARELLHEEGVIFISIDDNEVNQLKLVCDEVFGESNHLGTIIHNKLNSKSDTLNIQKNHDYLICYRKSSVNDLSLVDQEIVEKEVYQEENEFYLLNDPITTRGEGGTLNKRKNLGYTVYYNPQSGDFLGVSDYDIELALISNDEDEIYSDNLDLISKGYIKIRPPKVRGKLGVWTWDITKFNSEKDNILIKETKNGYTVRKRTFVSKNDVKSREGKFYIKTTKDSNTRSILEFSTNDGTTQLADVLGKTDMFSNPKNVNFLKYIFGLIQGNDFIAVDFFAGSGSSLQAIQELNTDDNGKRQFIAVQIDEPCKPDSTALEAGYSTIFDITKARIIKAAEKIASENEKHQGDLGFKIYETTNDFRPSVDDELQVSNESLFDDMVLSDEQYQALLTTWMLYDNNELTADIISVDLQGYNAKLINKNLYLIASDFGTQNLKCLLDKLDEDKSFAPDRIIVNGYNFDTAMQMELNEAIKSYQNKKKITINIIVRY